MANVVTNIFKKTSMEPGIDLTTAETLKVALLGDFFTTSAAQLPDVLTFSGDVQDNWEISGTNYVADGITLSGASVSGDYGVNDRSVFDADDVTWSSATITAYGAVIYRISDSMPICFIDFGAAKISTDGDFTIQWNANGIINLT